MTPINKISSRLFFKIVNFIVIYNTIVLGASNISASNEIPFRPPTPNEIMMALEIADTKRDRFGVSSFSNHLHQTISILVSLVTGGTIEPKSKIRSYDVLVNGYYIEIAANDERIESMPKTEPVIVLNKYRLAREWGLPRDLIKLSKLEEDNKTDISDFISDNPQEGIFKSPRYLQDESFLIDCSSIWTDIMVRKMSDPVEVDPFEKFIPKEINTRQQFNTPISRLPINYMMCDEEMIETISYSTLNWISSKGDQFETFDLENMKPEISASCKDGIWTLLDDEGDKIDHSGVKRYEISNDREFLVISKEYLDDLRSYASKRGKVYAELLSKNYGTSLVEISEPHHTPYTGAEWVAGQILPRGYPTDSNLWDLLRKAMPSGSRMYVNEAHTQLSKSLIFCEALFMREISSAILLHKRNTKRSRIIVKHKFLSLCASICIVGDISSNNADSGFAHVRFHYNLNDPTILLIAGYKLMPTPISGCFYRYISQGFKLRKPDISWYISLPEKMIGLVYSTLEEMGTPTLRKIEQADFDDMIKRCGQMLLCNLSIMYKASWGYSRVLKPFKYYVINVSQKSNFCIQTEDKLWEEINNHGGIQRYPELYMYLFNINVNLRKKKLSENHSPAFRLPIEMMGHEAYIMNLCPKQLYGRQRHSVKVFSKICEETDLYFDNISTIIDIRSDADRIYDDYKKTHSMTHQILYDHICLVENLSKKTGIRFIYSPISQCVIYQQLMEEKRNGMSTYGGVIHHPSYSELISTKGAFSTHLNKNCKAIEGMAILAKEVSIDYPITTLNAACHIMSKIIKDPESVPLLYAIVPKDQVGDDREISMMNEYFRILQCITESVARHYGKLTGVDKLSDPNKDSEFYKLVMMDGPMFAFIGDQTRWGPNFNTIVFGDMFRMFKTCGFPHTSIAHMVCYLAQRKIFLCPPNVNITHIEVRNKCKDLRYSGVSAPSHMGEGIFHYSSSLYHSLVSKAFCRTVNQIPGLSSFSTHMLVTSDDISYINKNIIETDIPILRNAYKGFQKFLTPMSIKTSNYKNMESETYAEFNSIAIFPKMRKYLYQTLKQVVGNVMIPTSHTFWNDQTASISTFNTLLNSGCSFSTSYMAYLLNTTLAYRRWSMLRIFYNEGFFRILTPKQLIQNEPLFPREYILQREDGNINIIKTSDSISVFKFKTYERLTNHWNTFRDMSMYMSLYADMRVSSLKTSPESNSTPLSRFILPSSFKERATVPIKFVPSAYHELKDICIPESLISIELAAVLSSQSWFKNKDEYHSLEIIKPQYESDISDEEYLSNIMSYLTMSLRTDTDISPILPRDEELTPAIHKLRNNVIPILNAESIVVENFGSYYDGKLGEIHAKITSMDGKGIRLSDRLKCAVDSYFNSYQEIFTFCSTLVRLVDDALLKSSLRITGLYTKDKNALYANYLRNAKTPFRIVKTSLSIPMSYIFKDPVISFKVNTKTRGIPYTGESLHLIDENGIYFEDQVPNLNMLQDSGDRLTGSTPSGNIYYKKPALSRFMSLSDLANYCDPLSVPAEDLTVAIVDSESFFNETIIHTEEKTSFDIMSIDDLMSQLSDGTLDTTSIQSFAVDNVLDSSQRRIEIEENTMPSDKTEEDDDAFGFFNAMNEVRHNVSVKSRASIITDPQIKQLIISCRDGYLLKHAMANWISDPVNELYEEHEIIGRKGVYKCFHSKMMAMIYSKVNPKRGGRRHVNELRTLATQIFESPPMIKSKFTREGNTLFISASILKLAQLSNEMFQSPDWHVSNMYTVPLLIISSLFGC